jgi:hypothetical protein
LKVAGILIIIIISILASVYFTKLSYLQTIKQMPITDKMAFYYQKCRQDYAGKTSDSKTTFGANLILHSTNQYNAFSDTEHYFRYYNFWEKGSSMADNWAGLQRITYIFDDYLNFTGEDIHKWIDDEINYRSDGLLKLEPSSSEDFFQSPIETITRKKGDCEDYAILSGAIFEKNNYETMFAIIHDLNTTKTLGNCSFSENYANFVHAFIFVKVNTEAYSEDRLWYFEKDGVKEWLAVDILWSEEFGEKVDWLESYNNQNYGNSLCFSEWEEILTVKEVKP